MKNYLLRNSLTFLLCSLFLTLFGQAQDAASSKPSPAAIATGKVGGANVTVKYSSPAVKGRTIWGDLVPYGKVWRAGANEATTFETDRDLKIEGKTLPAGKYSFFAIPTEKEWTLIFNKQPEQWGAYKYDEKQDALRVTVKPTKAGSFNERLGYSFTNDGMVLRWENLEVPVKIKS